MGKSHALSGAVGWLAICAAAGSAGLAVPDTVVAAGAVVSTGFALLPDIDHPDSTISRALGPATRALSTVVAWSAAVSRSASCPHCAGSGRGGHRGLTHTAVGAVTAGLLVALCALGWPRPTAAVVVGFGAWLAAHAALSSTARAKIGDMVLPGRFRRHSFRFTAAVGAALVAAAASVALTDPAVTVWWWLGVPVAWGCLVHSLGDALTYSAVPLLWPLRIRGCRWTAVGTPRWMRFRTGSRTETLVVVLLAATGAGSVYVLAGLS